MDFQVITKPIGLIETVYEENVEQPVDGDITLPEYYPDIQRILKCTVIPGISSSQASSGRIIVDGTALVRILYVAENGQIRSFEQGYPFSKTVEVNSLPDNVCLNVRAKTDYANCRAVSQRRVSVHGMITISIKARKRRSEDIVTGAQGAGIQLMQSTVRAVSMTACADKCFMMSEIIEIGQGKPPITQIIRSCGYVSVTDIKAISNKLLVKGELITNVLYCADTDGGELTAFEHSMPLSQIIEADGVSEDCTSDIKFNIIQLETTPKTDGNGELRLLDISARVCACVSSCVSDDIPVIADAYSVSHGLKSEYCQTEFFSVADSFRDSFTVKDSVEVSGNTKILDIWCAEVSSTPSIRDNELVISGTVAINIIYVNSENQPDYTEKQLDFEYKRLLRSQAEKIKCDPDVSVLGCSFLPGGDGKIDVRVEFLINAVVFEKQTHRIVSKLEPTEETEQTARAAALTIYFSDEGENVWSIARKYSTTVDAIMQENSLSDSTIAQKCMLMIPKA